jgi:hypothetical protein
MNKIRLGLLLFVVVTAFTACKKGGGYMHTAPEPVALP